MEAYPDIAGASGGATQRALHAYSRVLGDLLKSVRPRRKHWWHASLRPSLNGLTTGVVRAETPFEIEIDLRASRLRLASGDGRTEALPLDGQPAGDVRRAVAAFLGREDVAESGVATGCDAFEGYRASDATRLGGALSSIAAALETFRAGIREETSPIQVWPHHFDLSMIWLPGDKVPGVDPGDEESADRQMNFGFTFGDDAVPEPYFYVTAYPHPDWLHLRSLPEPAQWHAEGFEGALVRYARLIERANPDEWLAGFWRDLLAAGRDAAT